MRTKHFFLFAIIYLVGITGCKSDDDTESGIPQGSYNHNAVLQLEGFGEEKAALLARLNVSEETFITLSTAKAWELEADEQTTLKNIRNEVSKPDKQTLLQKVLPLEDVPNYTNNVYKTIGGFVAKAADVKSLVNMYDIYWGLRLDYTGTKFSETGTGYAVIRYYSSTTSRLKIPFSPELGGTQPHEWPNGGGGFTTSTLGEGGYPEWVSDDYNAPEEGAELYEITTLGKEQLRSVFKDGEWQTYGAALPTKTKSEPHTIRNGMFNNAFVTTYGEYEGYQFIIRGEANGIYHLTTTQRVPVSGLQVVERGIYGLQVPKEEVKNIHETVTDL